MSQVDSKKACTKTRWRQAGAQAVCRVKMSEVLAKWQMPGSTLKTMQATQGLGEHHVNRLTSQEESISFIPGNRLREASPNEEMQIDM